MPKNPPLGPRSGSLSDRELQVLAYQTTSLSGADICQEMGMSPRTLQRHTAAITGKLGIGHQRGAGRVTDAPLNDFCWPFS